jgi:hypothetical protein
MKYYILSIPVDYYHNEGYHIYYCLTILQHYSTLPFYRNLCLYIDVPTLSS